MSVVKELFTEKFRPKELTTLIVPERIRSTLSQGLVQNLLFYGSPGTGKTSTMEIMCKGYTTMRINAREEANVEIIRTKLSRFCATISLDGGTEKLKCVLIDEFDGATPGFFDAIKVPIEKYASIVRFIASTNYIQKIPPAVLDRFEAISFDAIDNEEEEFLIDEYKKRVALILKAAKITYGDDILDKFIRNDYPSMRRLLGKIQSLYLRGETELNTKNFNINFDFEDLYKMCLTKQEPYENYKFIVGEYSSKIDDTLNALSVDFIEYIKSHAPEKIDKIPMIIIAVAEHQAQRVNVIDPLITLLSAVYKIQLIVK